MTLTPLSRRQLRAVLNEWHWASPLTHPQPFPGPLADKKLLTAWLQDVRKRCAVDLNLSSLQWANAILSWIPEAPKGKTGLREQLLARMREKKRSGELENGRFWRWAEFKGTFFEMCASEVTKHRLKTAGVAVVATVGSAVLLPAVGLAVLGAVGFTSSGVAAGSLAAGVQSAVYGGATGGAFSVLQSIGARAAFPAVFNYVAGAVGGAAAAAASGPGNGTGHGGQRRVVGRDCVGDIGDDP